MQGARLKSRLFGFLCCALVPLLAILFGIGMLLKGTLFNLGFAITFFTIPLIAEGLLAWCIFSGSKTCKKVILSGTILAIFIIVFLFAFIITNTVTVRCYEGAEAEQQYSSVPNEYSLMPDLSAIGQPAEIQYYYVSSTVVIFHSETDFLICRYPPDEYEAQKARLEAEYTFQSETITDSYGSNCEPETEIDGYQFRLLSIEAYKDTLYYPQKIILIGYSDLTREIIYAEFEDYDLDCIRSLKSFIIDYCGWKYIR